MYNTQITNAHIMIYLKMIWHDLYTNYMNTKSYIDQLLYIYIYTFKNYMQVKDKDASSEP